MRFVSLILLCSIAFFAQAQEVQTVGRKPSKENLEKIRHLFDMKLYHDADFVKQGIKMMQQINPEDADLSYKGVLGEKDSSVLKNESVKKIGHSDWANLPWEEQEKLIEADPFEAFMAFVGNYQVPNLTKQELENLNTINKKTIPDTLIMITEAGPDIGTGEAPITYN